MDLHLARVWGIELTKTAAFICSKDKDKDKEDGKDKDKEKERESVVIALKNWVIKRSINGSINANYYPELEKISTRRKR